MNYIINNEKKTIKIGSTKDTIFHYIFNNIQKDIIWWGSVSTNSMFSPWDDIQTEQDTIIVFKRPIISDLTFKIEPPDYTKLESFQHPTNMSHVSLPYGSNVIITGSSNQTLKSATLTINDMEDSLRIHENNFWGNEIFKEIKYSDIILTDKFKSGEVRLIIKSVDNKKYSYSYDELSYILYYYDSILKNKN